MNALLRRIGFSLPIIQAPMAGVSTPAMASAVSNAGGLGSIGIGAADAETARAMIVAVRDATDRPFQVNVFCNRPAVADRGARGGLAGATCSGVRSIRGEAADRAARFTRALSRTTPSSPCCWRNAPRSSASTLDFLGRPHCGLAWGGHRADRHGHQFE